MAKEPIELGQDQFKLGFKADIDGMVDRFMNTIFSSIDMSGFPENDEIDKKDEKINQNQKKEKISSKNLANDVGLNDEQLNRINGIEKWFNEIGVPDLSSNIKKNRTQKTETSNEEFEKNVIDNIEKSTVEQIKKEISIADEKIKNEIIKQFPDGDVDLEEARHSGGIRDILKMFLKAIYKIIGFFVEKFIALLQPIVVLVKQLFFNFDPLNGKFEESLARGNPFPAIPDFVAYNILISLTAAAPPLNLIHVANQTNAIIEQVKQIIDLTKNVLIPIINFVTSPNSIIGLLLKTPPDGEGTAPFDGMTFPIPQVNMYFLGIIIPQMDKLGLFKDSQVGIDLNLDILKNQAKSKGKKFDSSKLLQPDLQKAFDNIGLDNILATPEIDKESGDDFGKKLIEKSPLLEEINFMQDIMKNPLMQMDYIFAIDSYVKDKKQSINEFYREPYIPSNTNTGGNNGWQYNFDFFKNFPLHTKKETLPFTLFNTNANKKGKEVDENNVVNNIKKTEKRGLWESIIEAGLHKDLKFIKKFYNYLRSYGNKNLNDLPELAQFMYVNNGAIVQSYKTNKEGYVNKSAIKFNVDRYSNDNNINKRKIKLEEPIKWDLSERDYQIYIDPYYKKNKNLKGIIDDISNSEEDYKNDISVVNYSIPWDGDILYAYRNWMKNSQKNDYFNNYINLKDQKYLFHNAFNNNDRSEFVKINTNKSIKFKSMAVDRSILRKLGKYRKTPLNINYVFYKKNINTNYSSYGFEIVKNNDNIDKNKYRKVRIINVSKFINFWQTMKQGEYERWKITPSKEYDINYLNLRKKHSTFFATYTDIVPIIYKNNKTYISGRILGLTNFSDLHNGNIMFISNRIIKAMKRFEYFYNIRNYLKLPNLSYFFLDTTVNKQGKVIDLNLNSFNKRKKFHERFLSQNSFFRFKIDFKQKNKMDDLFDFMLNKNIDTIETSTKNKLKIKEKEKLLKKLENENTRYGFVFRTPEIKRTEKEIKELQRKNVKYSEIIEKNFYNILKRSFDLNFWNTIPFESKGNEFNFKFGKTLEGIKIDKLYSKGINVASNYDFKKFKLNFWKIIPNFSYQYFNSHIHEFIVYFKEFTEYREYLTDSFSNVMRISNDREVNNETIKGIFENDNFRKKVNSNIDSSKSSKYRLPIGEKKNQSLFGDENYNADGIVDLKPGDYGALKDNLEKMINGENLNNGENDNLNLGSETSIPAFLLWFLDVITFIIRIVFFPINIVLTILEIVLKIIKNLLILNLPGVVEQIIELISFLTPTIGLFKNLIIPIIADDLLSSIFKTIEKYNKLGLNENEEAYNDYKNKLQKDSKKIQDECTKKQTDSDTKSWLQEVGVSETIFVTQDGIKKWLKSVGLTAEEIDFDLNKFRKDDLNQITKDTLICMSEGNLLNTNKGQELNKLKNQIDNCFKKKNEIQNKRDKAKKNYIKYNKSVINKIENQSEIFQEFIKNLEKSDINLNKEILQLKKINNINENNDNINNLGISAEILRFAKSGKIELIESKAKNEKANWYSLSGNTYIEKLEYGINKISNFKNSSINSYANNLGNSLINDLKNALRYKKEFDKESENYIKQKRKCEALQKTKKGLELADKSSNFSSKITDVANKFNLILTALIPVLPDLLKEFFKILKIIINIAFPKLIFDAIIELFRWVISQICIALPFLCSGDSSESKEEKQPTKEDLQKNVQSILNETIKNEEITEGIKTWLRIVGLDETILN